MTAYPPLRLRDGALCLGRGRLAPEGLVCPKKTFGWDDEWTLRYPDRTDWLVLLPGVFVDVEGRLAARLTYDPWLYPLRVDDVEALAAYLRDTPDARPGLADTARSAALLTALAQGHWLRTGLPHEPLAGDAHDLYWAVRNVLDRTWPRRWGNRPAAGEPIPDEAEVARQARVALRPALRDRWTDAEIRAQARRQLDVKPWPFSLLRCP